MEVFILRLMNLFKMRTFEAVLFFIISFLGYAQEPSSTKFNLGKEATQEEIALWDTDIKPDGEGLPKGQGVVSQGMEIFNLKCLMCHGYEGKNGANPTLVGRIPNDEFDFGNNHKLVRTVGNYWPYATTLYDYIWRAMPQLTPGSLTSDEVYHLTAYILSLNGIISEDEVINKQSLPKIKMPARDNFFVEK